jgi:hypothetical protein
MKLNGQSCPDHRCGEWHRPGDCEALLEADGRVVITDIDPAKATQAASELGRRMGTVNQVCSRQSRMRCAPASWWLTWTWVEEQLIDLSVAFSPVSIKS